MFILLMMMIMTTIAHRFCLAIWEYEYNNLGKCLNRPYNQELIIVPEETT